jgi:hypothetical protein
MSLLHSFVDGVFDFAGMDTALDEMLAAQDTLSDDEFAGKVAKMSSPMRYLALAAVRAEMEGNSHTPEQHDKLARLESALATA